MGGGSLGVLILAVFLGDAALANGETRPCLSIVGNGELTHSQRVSSVECALVMRFNRMENWQEEFGKTDICVFRAFPANGSDAYWGFSYPEGEKPKVHCPMILFTGEWNYTDYRNPLPPDSDILTGYVYCDKNTFHYGGKSYPYQSNGVMWSTGFCAVMWALNTFPNHEIFVYGFDFHGWDGHDFQIEKSYYEDDVIGPRLTFATLPAPVEESGPAADAAGQDDSWDDSWDDMQEWWDEEDQVVE